MIRRTDELHSALRDVANHNVVFHPGWTSHIQGYAWHDGGDMTPVHEQALRELAAVHLVAHIPACVCREIACEVVLTHSGGSWLSTWDSDTSEQLEVS